MDKSDWVLGWLMVGLTIAAVAIPPTTRTEVCLGGAVIVQVIHIWILKATSQQRETQHD